MQPAALPAAPHTGPLDFVRARQDQMLGAVGVGVWYCDLPFDVLMWDRKVKEHFWLPADAVVTIDTFYARLHPDDREPTRQAIDASIATRRAYDVEYRTVAPPEHAEAGAVRWVRAIGYTAYDDAGGPVRFDGVTVDVTAAKESAARLAASEQRYEFAARATSNAIWDWDLATDAVVWNPGVYRVFGYADGEVAPTAAWWHEQLHPDDRQRVVDGIHAVIGGGGDGHTWRGEYRFRRADGTYASVVDRGYVARDGDGRATRMIGAMADVSERKAAEAARDRALADAERRAAELAELTRALARSNQELDQFAYVASHDLKAPLRGIGNLAQWIEEDLGDAVTGESREHLRLLKGRVQRMEALIDGILAYSRAGRVRVPPEPVELGALAREAVELTSPPAGVRVEVAPDLPTVVAERVPLQQVLLNLVGNAVKFTAAHRAEGGVVRVEGRDAGAFVELVVRDNGPGIAPEFHDRVWGIFQTLQARDRVEGTGIGLSVVKKIVEARGGRAWVESAAGEGAAFHVTFPREWAATPPNGVPAVRASHVA